MFMLLLFHTYVMHYNHCHGTTAHLQLNIIIIKTIKELKIYYDIQYLMTLYHISDRTFWDIHTLIVCELAPTVLRKYNYCF